VSALPEVSWTLSRSVATSSPSLSLRCPRCDGLRPHVFTERARVNANKARLDAWLLFSCIACKRTHKHVVFRRTPVTSVPPELLEALHRNDVERLTPLLPVAAAAWSLRAPPVDGAATVVLSVDDGLRVRLDKVLAQGLGCSRREVKGRVQGRVRLSRPARDQQRIEVFG